MFRSYGAVLLSILLSVFLPCCLHIFSSNWYRWILCFKGSLFFQLVMLGVVAPLTIPSGTSRAELLLMKTPPAKSGLNAQVVTP